ncbi:uncharacterized protein C9orf85 homolog [Scyliorhinus torazame]|uniref:uncharacterized protein C9orf85 homolog n=1 Tax=Scyliorhinus torazame TaxID=75743 RepID=UPI003B5B3977
MSTEKGNVARRRAQKHQNVIGFKNDKYIKSDKIKRLNAMMHSGVCKHCKEVLEWKVKYNKYKPLSQARKCVKCLQKTVKDSYHVMCKPCAFKLELCAKCGKREEIVNPLESAEDQHENCDEEINPGTRNRVKSGKGDDDASSSTDDSDFDSDEGSDGKDLDYSVQSSFTHLSTQHADTASQKEKATKTEGTVAHGVPDLSTLTLDV